MSDTDEISTEEETLTKEGTSFCRLSKYALGVSLIFAVAIIWVAASEWIQRIFGDFGFNKPYFLTYFNTTGFCFWNLCFLSRSWREPKLFDEIDLNEKEKQNYSVMKVFRCAMLFCPLWFLANALFNYSLSTTSVASNTILSSTSSIWTLVLSKVLLNQELLIWHKVLAVGLQLAGSCLIGFSDGSGSSGHSIVGDLLAIISAIFYAAYTTVLKWSLEDDERYFMGMVFGFVGIINLVTMWPGLVLLDVTGIEPFELPSGTIFWALALNALVGTNLSDVLWAKSVVLTSPLVATLGLSLSTPTAMLADAIFRGKTYSGLYISGAILVTIGFIICSVQSRK